MAELIDWEAHPTMQALVAAAQAWRNASFRHDAPAATAALQHYREAATTLIGLGVTFFDLDPMDRLPDHLMPLVWQDAYADAFADAVAQRPVVVAAD